MSLVFADADLAVSKKCRHTPMPEVTKLRNVWGGAVTPDKSRTDIGYMLRGEIPHDIVAMFSDTGTYIYFLEAIAQIIPAMVMQERMSRY